MNGGFGTDITQAAAQWLCQPSCGQSPVNQCRSSHSPLSVGAAHIFFSLTSLSLPSWKILNSSSFSAAVKSLEAISASIETTMARSCSDIFALYRWVRGDGVRRDVAFHRVKKNKAWIIKALDRGTRRTVAWVLGRRDSATFRRLYEKVRHLKGCVFYTDAWGAFSEVLPPERHVVGKAHTVAIERDNSNTRHHPGRFTRRTKVVSQTGRMVDLTMRIWQAVTTTSLFD